jgi:hypothetical protein
MKKMLLIAIGSLSIGFANAQFTLPKINWTKFKF